MTTGLIRPRVVKPVSITKQIFYIYLEVQGLSTSAKALEFLGRCSSAYLSAWERPGASRSQNVALSHQMHA